MKKMLALLLTAAMAFSVAACAAPAEKAPVTEAPTSPTAPEAPPADKAVEKVTYYCTIGAYLKALQKEIDKYNQGEGKDAGVYIELDSNINEGSAGNEPLMQAGTYHDLTDGTDQQSWVLNGWVKNLEEIDDPDLKALIDSYRPYMVPGMSYINGILTCLPLEILPLKFAVNTDLFKKNNLELPKTWADVVNAAKVITENGGGEVFGYGGCTWTNLYYDQTTMKGNMRSTKTYYWDPNTGTYDFSQYEVLIKALRDMYQNGYMLGLDDLGIDEIRAQFAAGKVGMFPAPAYDISVYTNQFPAECNWEIIDMPTFEPGPAPYKGVYMTRVNCGICAPAYDNATPAHQAAIVKAFLFINSDYLNTKMYEAGGMIPAKPELIAQATDVVDIPQWEKMGDVADYVPECITPNSVLSSLEGDEFFTVFNAIVHGDLDWNDEVISDLNKRYNDAWAAAVEDPDINTDLYVYEYNHSK